MGKSLRFFPTGDLCTLFAHPTISYSFWWAKVLEFSLQVICVHFLPTLQNCSLKTQNFLPN
ncbi:MAG: hypothetical protein F6J98_12625 [Moorea sp. SIO4G2]|nr:hypothetical protein [Moorena sp. SIO4G2]